MKFGRMAGAVAASAALVLGVANTAAAADHTMHTGDVFGKISGWSGTGYFNEYGDVVTICDKDADGYAVKMFVYLDKLYSGKRYDFYVGGNGRCATRKAAMGGKYNLPENRKIAFLFCRYKAGKESECKGYTYLNDH
ncbi:hypothetical protein ACL02U_27370 [Streptomyces sp. MS06]|uniref:hypothetical protein n=1 Tax=Streptomyces sp. MS06 TaxID=3385974 RepID=UPI0039A36029